MCQWAGVINYSSHGVAFSVQSYDINQCCLFVNWTFQANPQHNMSRNTDNDILFIKPILTLLLNGLKWTKLNTKKWTTISCLSSLFPKWQAFCVNLDVLNQWSQVTQDSRFKIQKHLIDNVQTSIIQIKGTMWKNESNISWWVHVWRPSLRPYGRYHKGHQRMFGSTGRIKVSSLQTQIAVCKLGHYWFRWWLVYKSASSYYLKQCGRVVNWAIEN